MSPTSTATVQWAHNHHHSLTNIQLYKWVFIISFHCIVSILLRYLYQDSECQSYGVMLKADWQRYGRWELWGWQEHTTYRSKDMASTYRLCPHSRTRVSLILDEGLQTVEGDEYAEIRLCFSQLQTEV